MTGNAVPACADQKAYTAANVMDFFMGPSSYEGPTLCAWFAPANNDGNHPKLEPIDLCDLIDLVAHDDWVADLVSDAICYSPALGDIKIATQEGKSPGEYFEKVALIENEARDSQIDLATTRRVIDRLQAEAQRLLNIDHAALMQEYSQATARLMEKLNAPLPAEIQLELDELLQPKAKPSKPKDYRPAVFRAIDIAVSGMPREIDALDLNTLCNRIVTRRDFDANAKEYLIGEVAKNTHLRKSDARAAVNESISVMRKKNKAKPKKGRSAISLGDHRADSDRAYEVMTDQGDAPEVFQNGGRMVDVPEDESGSIRIATIDKPRFKGAHFERRLDLYRETASGDVVNVAAPEALVNRVYHMPLSGYPPLYRITSFPTYSKEMSLVMDPGYHAGSGLYHQPKRGVTIPQVPEVPTEEEMLESRENLVDLVADFPLDGMLRPEIVAAVKNGDPVPSLAHALSVALTPIMRDTINGPTPNHLGRKDKPRTGATLLMSAMSCVGTLEPAAPQLLPESRSEVQKTLTAIVDSGAPYAFLDNLSQGETTESDELAGAMTAFPEYTGRRLGFTGMVKARVTQTWLTTGNRTQLSEQLRERTLLIDLDPQMELPGARPSNMFKHWPLMPHIEVNAGQYMRDLLVLVQYWKAKGCPEWEGQPLGGFEDHARKIGGILDCAGIFGFMANRDKLRERMAIAQDPETELLDSMIEEHLRTPTLFRVWSADAPPTKVKNDAGELVDFEYAKHRVVSVQELLAREQIAIKKWGYDYEGGDVIYPSKAKPKVTYHFGAMEGTVREWREAQTEIEAQQRRYVLTKVHKDKHGTLYRLEQLPLIG